MAAASPEPKPYLVLARKYRPQTFDDVVGQEPIAVTLKNAITLNRIGHAYLFTGPRGVGKTSMARIFAKALNCVSGPTVKPCGECPACREIESSRSLDVLEVDGASNRGIDEIRALRENVRFAPSAGKFKIYIIDEVHQITADGFNALLKTLEEPPRHVKFIFATTSVQKVPATILSRCQRFDFRRIPTERIAETLREICKKEKIKAEDEALFAVAKAADGSLRDSQTILDQIAASAENKISTEDVTRSLGSLEEEKAAEIMAAISKKDARAALTLLDGVLNEGKDPVFFLERILEHVRHLLFLQISPDLLDLVDATEAHRKLLLKQKDAFSRESLFYAFSVLMHTLQTLKRFDMKRIPLEIALIRLAHQEPMREIAEALDQLKRVQKKTPAAEIKPSSRPLSAPKAVETSEEEKDDMEELPSGDLEVAATAAAKSASLDAVWPSLIQAVKGEKMSIGSYLAEGQPGGLEQGVASIGFTAGFSFCRETLDLPDNRRLIEKHLARLLDGEVKISFDLIREITQLAGESQAAAEAAAPAANPEDNPAVKSAINIFGGRVIR